MWSQERFGKNNELFGIVQEPSNLTQKDSLVITLPGLGQAMSEKNYLFSNLRKRLALTEQWQVQFDYFGHGDSYGELGDASITSMVNNTLEVINEVTKYNKPRCIYLVGNALGGIIALKVISQLENKVNAEIIPILISPPSHLPKIDELISDHVIQKVKKEGRLDSQYFVPGYDYYTLSDFNLEQYKYFTSLGAHMLYLHGQCISYNMLKELNELEPVELFKKCQNTCHVIVGKEDKDAQTLSELQNVLMYELQDVAFYHQHPAAMDELIDIIQNIIRNNECI
ncbi:lysophospholipase [Bacillus infantis]|uniref:Lysophospholipase n=1 Tax=Bacillus infantis TaxID=324767 RepID=A0A5D4SAL0_9BACI|nr:alpha/beta hydrolase [Bacillus infantis]TYS60653.1 lysophospholipase [Bacillus infantis]